MLVSVDSEGMLRSASPRRSRSCVLLSGLVTRGRSWLVESGLAWHPWRKSRAPHWARPCGTARKEVGRGGGPVAGHRSGLLCRAVFRFGHRGARLAREGWVAASIGARIISWHCSVLLNFTAAPPLGLCCDGSSSSSCRRCTVLMIYCEVMTLINVHFC